MEALQRHRYGDAAGNFRMLLEKYPAERALLDRARVYLELCERELKRKPADPRTVEERLTAATAALNDNNDAEAERLARSVLADEARHDTAMYLLAAIEARRGATDAAMSYLSQTIAISPEAKAQARYDADFETLRGHPAFQELIETPAGGGGPRRARRGRTER
jgi:cytochrome c-type biogenesis protein CcmH/NrfG